MTKKIYKSLIIILTLILTVGCVNTNNGGNNSGNNSNTNDEITDSKVKGNCATLECIKLIGATDMVEQINNIIGFEGESQNEYNDLYYWKITDKTGIQVAFMGGESRNRISAQVPESMMSNKKVDLSNIKELSKKSADGKSLFYQQLTYEQFKNYVGKVDGVLIVKDNTSLTYMWVVKENVYALAEFSTKTGKCISLIRDNG